VFLAEYGLSTEEGISLMCLAEALLRVPDADTMDALIEDKIAPGDWGRHLGKSASSLVNASTWALMLTGKVLEDTDRGVVGHLRAAVKRLGEPVIRRAVAQAMKEMGRQFVLGEDIAAAMKRAEELEAKGYTYSYDMLGEAARTEGDARRYHLSYSKAITAIAAAARGNDIRANPGISVKLSALHPRYEVAKEARVMAELVPRVRALAGLAKAAGLGFNIDAEEADRLALSCKVIEAVLEDPSLAGWDGFGVVVQAYGRRAGAVIDWLYATATRLDRRIMVRLVKGAYWDAEVKRAQVLGLESFPVFTRKQATDVSYIACAKKLLGMTDRIYPQFATHNAHTVAAVLELADDPMSFEFQRLHGMGERLHDLVLTDGGTRCRIYAPVGAHRDLLAYLVRRLLENGANSSFVNQIVDEDVSPEVVAACPLTAMESLTLPNPALPAGPVIFGARVNARGWDLTDAGDLAAIAAARDPHQATLFTAGPVVNGARVTGAGQPVLNPATGDVVGHVVQASDADVAQALQTAGRWDAPADQRAAVLMRAADLYEAAYGPVFALLAREAGKTLADAVAELREAVDFLRYYAAGAAGLAAPARGVFACISPWNFPLAIFTGQIAAALAAGNGVIAKPAEQTPLIAGLAVDLLHRAGVPGTALQFLPGDGATVGAALSRGPAIDGIAFTGSTETAKLIRAAMAGHLAPTAPLIAETGGLNAMLVDSTALPEQAVRDVIASAFQSAGQRCSALRCLYLQEDVAGHVEAMLLAAMDDLSLGDPWDLATDIGPVIDAEARDGIVDYIAAAQAGGRVVKSMPAPAGGTFVGPTVIRVNGIADMPREIFGPVLHIAHFAARDLTRVIDDVNATGYGLTFGLHTRIDDRVQRVIERLRVGNAYVNRNQIGAVVGSQPFGGEGLSGTGPKAGGPHYLVRFTAEGVQVAADDGVVTGEAAALAALRRVLADPRAVRAVNLPGPTGESNRLSSYQRAPLICLGPSVAAARAQAAAVRAHGGLAVEAPGLAADALERLPVSGAVWWGGDGAGRDYAQALAARSGAILPLIGSPDAGHALLERHVCIDTTASGGNAELLATVAD
jgi:RHH-type transcriptional regulator, proline utilization regulon repressor / proline dehydrogenase / delta 1-pyrroline-5-carboxylate dehydrogenase